MRRFRIVAVLLTAGLFCPANAQLSMTDSGGGFGGAAAYVGPGDIVSGALAWWGLRCYNAAYAGNVADVYAPADASHTLITCSAGGTLNETVQPLATTCAISCTIKTLYDQSGNGQDATQATEAIRPSFTLNGLGSLPIITSSSTKFLATTGLVGPFSQPNWVSAVVQTTSSANQAYWGDAIDGGGGGNSIGFNGANTASLYASGGPLTASATTSAWHSVQSLMSGVSSEEYIDGVSTTGSAGTGAISSSALFLGKDIYSNFLTGFYTEMGLWNTSPSGGQKSSLNANQHTYWGF